MANLETSIKEKWGLMSGAWDIDKIEQVFDNAYSTSALGGVYRQPFQQRVSSGNFDESADAEEFKSSMLEKINSGANLSEFELGRLVKAFEASSAISGAKSNPNYRVSIVDLNGRLFRIDWLYGLGEKRYPWQPYEVTCRYYDKVKGLIEWVRVDK